MDVLLAVLLILFQSENQQQSIYSFSALWTQSVLITINTSGELRLLVSRYRFRGNTVEQATVPAVLPQWSVLVPREIRGYRDIPVVAITAQLCRLAPRRQ